MNKAVPVLHLVPAQEGTCPESLGLHGRPVVRVHLLGPMRATTYLGANILPHGKRARAVLAYLCLAGGEHVSREQLARLLAYLLRVAKMRV